MGWIHQEVLPGELLMSGEVRQGPERSQARICYRTQFQGMGRTQFCRGNCETVKVTPQSCLVPGRGCSENRSPEPLCEWLSTATGEWSFHTFPVPGVLPPEDDSHQRDTDADCLEEKVHRRPHAQKSSRVCGSAWLQADIAWSVCLYCGVSYIKPRFSKFWWWNLLALPLYRWGS